MVMSGVSTGKDEPGKNLTCDSSKFGGGEFDSPEAFDNSGSAVDRNARQMPLVISDGVTGGISRCTSLQHPRSNGKKEKKGRGAILMIFA